MAIEKISIVEALKLSKSIPVIDVRSEGEFIHAHIPKAYNLPLFNNEERKIVGTIYKQQSREHAIKKGLDIFGPKMKRMILFAEKIKEETNQDTFIVHCWRGGMRSAAIAWLFDMYGFRVYTIVGGYKSYRDFVLKQFEKNWLLNIVGGYTGSGKTIVLEKLQHMGEATIDLEGIAGHRGSAFGRIGLPEQSSVEMFENNLANKLFELENEKPDKNIWIEDESQRIGSVSIPQHFWNTMRKSIVYFIEIPFEKRLEYLVDTYGKLDKTELTNATIRIEKKLGGLEMKNAVSHIGNDELDKAFEILLKYYDKLYLKSLLTREEFDSNKKGYKKIIVSEKVDSINNAKKLLNEYYGSN